MSNVESELRSLVTAFVNELRHLTRQEALESVAAALQAGAPAPVRRGPGRPRGSTNAARAAKAAAEAPKAAAPKAAPASRARKAGEKRKPEDLARLVDQLAEHIKGNAGQGVEEISKNMGVPTKELTLPIKKLLADKRIASKGQKRATKYFPR